MTKKFISTLLTVVAFFSLLSPVCFSEASVNEQVIRIAYTDDSPFLYYSNNNYQGYVVEYLDEISRYTHWDYVFVPCSWSEALDMLDNGAIDFIPNAEKGLFLEEKYIFSKHYLIKDESIIYTKEDRDLCYEEFDAFDGLTFGFLRETLQPEFFDGYASDNHFTYHKKFYNSGDEMLEAYNANEIDALVDDAFTTYPDFKIIGEYAPTVSYFMAARSNKEKMALLDHAMDTIAAKNPTYAYDIYKKHFSGLVTSSQPLFTREEKDYIENAGELRVGCYADAKPYSFQDENGNYQGIVPYLIRQIAEKSGLNLVPTTLDASRSSAKQLNGELDLIAGVVLSKDLLRSDQYQYTDSFSSEVNYIIMPENTFINSLDGTSLALPKASTYFAQYIKSHYPTCALKYYETITDCLDSVVSGETDCALLDSYVADYWLDCPRYHSLQTNFHMSITEPTVILADSSTDEILISILNKTMDQISQQELQNAYDEIVFENRYQYTLEDFVQEHKKDLFFLAALTLVILIALGIITRRLDHLKAEQREKELLRIKAETDSLTGLYNIDTFYEHTKERIENAEPDSYFIVITDIEHFKIINDIHGYGAGDELIRFIGSALKELATPYDGLCSRLSGDRFACLLPTTIDVEKDFAKPLQTKLDQYPLDTRITACMGVYYIHDLALPVYMMCDRARLACVSAQGKYDTHVSVFDDAQRTRLLEEHTIVNEMAEALASGQFRLFIQPKNNITNGNAIGGEALVRWIHPEKGLLSPGVFIPIFERNGFITKLDLYILEQTLITLDRWRKEGKKLIPISVNISRVDFYMPTLVDKICALCEKYRIPHDYLQLEITESAYFDDMKFVVKQLVALQKKGFHILMDDFGSEYSSLSMLKDAPVDILKLDIRFLRNTGDATRGKMIIRSIVQLAKELQIDLIVEGVEDEDQIEFLRSIHCEAVQGFYFSKPLPLEDFETYLKTHMPDA
ncbi:MAG: EAL domain-containing protein [Lachnospiraceae bacterium]